MDIIDLHAHTTASDGSLHPGELVQLAKDIGLLALAVTDHDTLEGVPEALEYGKALGLEVVQGVEISAEFKPGTMHVLGYDIDVQNHVIDGKLKALQEGRRTRNPKIISKLREMDIDITMDEVTEVAGGGQIGRPHFAQVLLRKGYVESVQEAFDLYLAKGGPAYLDKFRFFPREAIEVILEAGGLPVLAHPFSLKLDHTTELESLIAELVEYGLVGLEVYYSKHTPEMTDYYLGLAERFGLAPTGGSDFHGISKSEIQLGKGLGNLAVPYRLLTGLRNARKGIK